MNDRPTIHMPLTPGEHRLMRQWRTAIDRGDLCRACGGQWGPELSPSGTAIWALHHRPACKLMRLEDRVEALAVAS